MKNKVIGWFVKIVSCIALVIAAGNVNATCTGIIYQPKIPDKLWKYRK